MFRIIKDGASLGLTEKLNYIHNHKTGDLIIGALIMGAIAAGSDETALSSFSLFLFFR